MLLNSSRPTRKTAAIVMMLIVFMTMMKSFAFAKETFLSPPSTAFTYDAALQAGPDGSAETENFKPPKNLFMDYDSFFSNTAPLLRNRIDLTRLSLRSRHHILSGIRPDIFIPPES